MRKKIDTNVTKRLQLLLKQRPKKYQIQLFKTVVIINTYFK